MLKKNNTGLTRKQQAAILALITQRTIEDAARVAGVSSRTLYRWIKEPEFDTAYREAKRASFLQAKARLYQMGKAAVIILGNTMADPKTPAATRLRAADRTLELIGKFAYGEELDARVAALENLAETVKGAGAK